MGDKLIREKDLIAQMCEKLTAGHGRAVIIKLVQDMPAASAIELSAAEAEAFESFRHFVKLAVELQASVSWAVEELGYLEAMVGIIERAIGGGTA